MSMDRVVFTINGIEYQESGFLGCQLKSVERGRYKLGDCRVILDELFYIMGIKSKIFRPATISWCLINPTVESVRAFYTKLRGGNGR